MQQHLKLMIDLFEKKIQSLEIDYKKRHQNDFVEGRMRKFINRKLSRDIKMLICCNIVPSAYILEKR